MRLKQAHSVNSNWMGTTNSKHHIHLQSNVDKYSSHLVIHANRFIVALSNPFLTDIQVAAHEYRKKIASEAKMYNVCILDPSGAMALCVINIY